MFIFQPSVSRSKTIILAKNLPANTTSYEITNMFKKFGHLGRIVMPPNGLTALIEFLEPSEARTAFTKLAYSKFKNLPLYLEWAPENTFLQPFKPSTNTRIQEVISEENSNTLEPEKKGDEPQVSSSQAEEVDDEEPEENTTLFIKNLNFETREPAIRDVCILSFLLKHNLHKFQTCNYISSSKFCFTFFNFIFSFINLLLYR